MTPLAELEALEALRDSEGWQALRELARAREAECVSALIAGGKLTPWETGNLAGRADLFRQWFLSERTQLDDRIETLTKTLEREAKGIDTTRSVRRA